MRAAPQQLLLWFAGVGQAESFTGNPVLRGYGVILLLAPDSDAVVRSR